MKEALKRALEALEYHTYLTRPIDNTYEAIAAIKKALAQPAQQEPVAAMQPVVEIDGVSRFKANAIVQHLLDTHPTSDMNALACMNFTDNDRMQFAQLIGYSLAGYSDLSYVSDESHEAAHLTEQRMRNSA